MIRLLLAGLLFVAFVPGVFVTLPRGASRSTILLVHALLFVIVTNCVMRVYSQYFENFGNYGAPGCPPSFVMNSDGVCKPDPSCSGPSCTTPGIRPRKE